MKNQSGILAMIDVFFSTEVRHSGCFSATCIIYNKRGRLFIHAESIVLCV